MPMKTEILAAIGEDGLQLAATLNAALAANDRLKYVFSLLQMAVDHAAHPEQAAATLKRERDACGIDDAELDGVIAASRMKGKACRVTGARRIVACIADDVRLMAAPVLATKPAGLAARIDGLLAALPIATDDLLDPAAVSAITRIGHDKSDSLHGLVMDLHKRLNAMQAALSEEKLDGAAVYGLAETDRPFVAAFMAGVNRTARLKFSHPGLATTATRAGGRLVIQNDIGTTDAHVIVIHVRELAVSVTYTDVHPERLAFFQEMLKPQGVVWDGQRTALLAAGAPFYLATGLFNAADATGCGSYLEFLGSRLVFLIDWNRARKQLHGFLRGPDRIALLLWAVTSETGHRGFLEVGGERLVNQAIEATAGSAMHFGDRLCDVLGDKETMNFLHFVFHAATDGILSHQSHTLIRDRIRGTLATYFRNEERQLLRLAGDHACLIFELACMVRDGLSAKPDDAEKLSRHARQFEHDADQMVVDAGEAARRRPEYAVFKGLLEQADDAANELENAAFLLGLAMLEGKLLEALQGLADLVATSSQEWIKALGDATQIGLAESQNETEDFLTAIDHVAALGHRADEAERALAKVAVQHARDFRELHVVALIGDKLKAAAAALRHSSSILREHVLRNLING
jgi:uncharacterized protein Yka (UPF0111/DUF47 family)